jgi:hypothetical protein
MCAPVKMPYENSDVGVSFLLSINVEVEDLFQILAGAVYAVGKWANSFFKFSGIRCI